MTTQGHYDLANVHWWETALLIIMFAQAYRLTINATDAFRRSVNYTEEAASASLACLALIQRCKVGRASYRFTIAMW